MIKKIVLIILVVFLVSCNNAKINYTRLGFTKNFDEDIEIPRSKMYPFREKGEKNFLENISLSLLEAEYELPSNIENFDSIIAYSSYFNDEIYNKFYFEGLSEDYKYCVAPEVVQTGLNHAKYEFRFFNIRRLMPQYGLPYIDIIESNEHYSFVVNYRYIESDFSSIQSEFFELFYLIYHDDNFPYNVYLDNSYIYLMNKSSNFDDSYLEAFKENNVYLFKK